MKRNKKISLILIIYIITSSYSSNNWTIGNNSIIINAYTSKLTDEQRENYYYWVGLRNSFYYSEDSNQLEKLVKYFTPEEKNYYRNLFNFSAPGFICASGVVIIFLVYIAIFFLFSIFQNIIILIY